MRNQSTIKKNRGRQKQVQKQKMSSLQNFSLELNQLQWNITTMKLNKNECHKKQTIFPPIHQGFRRAQRSHENNTYWGAQKRVINMDRRLEKLQMDNKVLSRHYYLKMLQEMAREKDQHYNYHTRSNNTSYYQPSYILQPLIVPFPNYDNRNFGCGSPQGSEFITQMKSNHFTSPPSYHSPINQYNTPIVQKPEPVRVASPSPPPPPSTPPPPPSTPPPPPLNNFPSVSNNLPNSTKKQRQNSCKKQPQKQLTIIPESKPIPNQNLSKPSSPNFPQQSRLDLLRRFRTVSIGIYFIFIFQRYARTITYHRYIKFLQVQELMERHQVLEYYLFEKYMKYDVFEKFCKLCKVEQGKKQNLKYQFQINFQNQTLSINVKVCHMFIEYILEKIEKAVKNGQFETIAPIFMNFLDRGFPPNYTFLQKQLQLMNLHPEFGWLNVNPEMSKLLMMVYFFVKIFVYQSVGKRQILPHFYKKYLKQWQQRKFILLYGKKIVATIIILYSAINTIYLSTLKKQVQPNYFQVPQNARPQPLEQMEYDFNMSSKEKIKSESEIINQLKCDQSCTAMFIEMFEGNWRKMQEIVEMLYESAEEERQRQLLVVKQEVLNQRFPDRYLLHEIRNLQLTEQLKEQLTDESIPMQYKLNNIKYKYQDTKKDKLKQDQR